MTGGVESGRGAGGEGRGAGSKATSDMDVDMDGDGPSPRGMPKMLDRSVFLPRKKEAASKAGAYTRPPFGST